MRSLGLLLAAFSLLSPILLQVSRPATVGPAQTASGATTSALPVPRAEGTLKVYAQIALPIAPGDPITAAEAPNGAVFAAQQTFGSGVPSVVWVVDGYGPPAVAEHVSKGASALAADSANLYVANYKTLSAFSRATGNEIRHWALPAFSTANTSDDNLVDISAFDGTVLVMVPLGHGVGIYRVSSTSSAAPRLVVQGSSAVFGPEGSTYLVSSQHRLIRVSANGATTVGPQLAYKSNSEGGGVDLVDTVAGGLVWVGDPAGQGLDVGFTTFNDTTLREVSGPFGASLTEQIVGTAAGALALTDSDGPAKCPQHLALSTSCVYRISATGALSDPTPVGPADQLLGPDPAVITTNGSDTTTELDRLA